MKPPYLKRNRLKILEYFLTDLENQFKRSPFDEVQYTVNPKQLEKETTITKIKAGNTIKSFLRFEKKHYETRPSYCGKKYTITVNRSELEKWKKDIENLK